MSKRKTTEEFIERSKIKHGDKYDYSLSNYINAKIKIKIICHKHGIFEQLPSAHVSGQGCKKCYYESEKYDTKLFIEKANSVHKNKYDYSLVDYINNQIEVKIICKKHGSFEQRPVNHLSGRGCRQCFIQNNTKNTKWFIDKAEKLHNNKFDYSLVNYTYNTKKVRIICSIHGIFEQTPDLHLRGHGCIKCRNKSRSSNNENFIEKSNILYNFLYDYILVEYKNAHTKVNINCKKHGIFQTTPHNHLHGKGCPKCWKSKKEIFIENILKENNVEYFPQKKFKNCKHKRALPFDFYLPKFKTCIEYDGEQHFMNISCWGGDTSLKENQLRDNIKTEYCNKNNINLIRIKYNQNIKEILIKLIQNYSLH